MHLSPEQLHTRR